VNSPYTMCSECTFITSAAEDAVKDQNMLGQLYRVLSFNGDWAGLTAAAEQALSPFSMQSWCRLLCGRLCVIQTANVLYVMGSVDSISICCKLDTLYEYMPCRYIG
jgi:hypothetical protein